MYSFYEYLAFLSSMRFWDGARRSSSTPSIQVLCEPRIFKRSVCPIYGFGMVIIVFCLTPLQKNWLLLFFGSMFLTSALEWITGYVLKKGVSHQLVGLFQSAF